jgi:signal transduction histidine kinase
LYVDQARLKNIEFSYEIDPELLTVVIDETRMFQLLNNLISNSFKFTIEGHIKVKISKDLSI